MANRRSKSPARSARSGNATGRPDTNTRTVRSEFGTGEEAFPSSSGPKSGSRKTFKFPILSRNVAFAAHNLPFIIGFVNGIIAPEFVTTFHVILEKSQITIAILPTPVDVAILKTRPMDESGFFNFGATNLWHRAIIERAKLVIIEITEGLPYVFGERNGLYKDEVDYIIEGDHQPAFELPRSAPSEVDRAVARFIAGDIEDGACLQIGIGGMPNAACLLLLESGVRNLGVHSEMLADGMIDLYKAGRIIRYFKKAQHW